MRSDSPASKLFAPSGVLAVISAVWVAWHIYYLNGGYREQVLDQFLRSPEADYAIGALVNFITVFSLPTITAVIAFYAWTKEKSSRSRLLIISMCAAWLIGFTVYVTRPSLDTDMQQLILEQMNQPR